ncbi:DNA cytosine methyltransferase [Streptomyces filamentosus]|uniref:Cytosine-specific methyltransferase n=1 Tax=Streptomyces filamentosus TaxID=67294 RepID=A0A919BLC9_STRFL|nr:DNA (cytosine-5-)-methyltransferase [Streptomyces filamentosus]GHF99583.1 cytosine-specific methyltransferase [Streptomyces filamentosus]
MASTESEFTSIEICAGAGGQAIGLHRAGFRHLALVEIDKHARETLRRNIEARPDWSWEERHCDLSHADVTEFEPLESVRRDGKLIEPGELDLLAGGVPCPPFSHAGKQLGRDDERDLFPRMLYLVEELKPRAVMIENVRGILDPKFSDYRDYIKARLQGGTYRADDGSVVTEEGLGYEVCHWDILEAHEFGVPQLRPRAILVAIRQDVLKGDLKYEWPTSTHESPVSVVKALEESMEARYRAYYDGPRGQEARAAYARWHNKATERHEELVAKGGAGIAPTLVGGSKKHGGADLGPSRAKATWKQLGVSGLGVANDAETARKKQSEDRDLFGPDGPMLTVEQAAIVQGFPGDWIFDGGKTAQYRQVGNAFPPPVAEAVGRSIMDVLKAARERDASQV